MNEPLVDPMFFYWVKVLDGLHGISGFLSATSFVAALIATVIFVMVFLDDDYFQGEIKITAKRFAYISYLTTTLFFLIYLFTPDRKTMYYMVLSKHITPSNIELLLNKTDKAIDKIIEKIEKIKNS